MYGLRKTEQSNKEAVDWNNIKNEFTTVFWQQNIRQFWIDEEIPLSDDKLTWKMLSPQEQEVYKKVTAGLTLLDTEQASVGMPQVALCVDDLHAKAILGFMGMMEHMHAKSYSSIFSTLCTMQEIDELFEWTRTNIHLQNKLRVISNYYNTIIDDKSLYMAMVASVCLETYLFYSGFFYPLLLAGQGKLTASGEIINLIIRDESVHGVYVGILAQEIYNTKLSPQQKREVDTEVLQLVERLFVIEEAFVKEIYTDVGLVDEVTTFVKYNADKALMNLGHATHYNVSELDVNGVVIAGLRTETKNHDFFSVKGNGYIKTTNVDALSDDDFDF